MKSDLGDKEMVADDTGQIVTSFTNVNSATRIAEAKHDVLLLSRLLVCEAVYFRL